MKILYLCRKNTPGSVESNQRDEDVMNQKTEVITSSKPAVEATDLSSALAALATPKATSKPEDSTVGDLNDGKAVSKEDTNNLVTNSISRLSGKKKKRRAVINPIDMIDNTTGNITPKDSDETTKNCKYNGV